MRSSVGSLRPWGRDVISSSQSASVASTEGVGMAAISRLSHRARCQSGDTGVVKRQLEGFGKVERWSRYRSLWGGRGGGRRRRVQMLKQKFGDDISKPTNLKRSLSRRRVAEGGCKGGKRSKTKQRFRCYWPSFSCNEKKKGFFQPVSRTPKLA